jgi:hypothetical protein
MNADNTEAFKVVIEVEADRTCAVRAPSMNSLTSGPGRGKITGLNPEQATHLKTALEDAFQFGRGRTLCDLHDHIGRELGRRG